MPHIYIWITDLAAQPVKLAVAFSFRWKCRFQIYLGWCGRCLSGGFWNPRWSVKPQGKCYFKSLFRGTVGLKCGFFYSLATGQAGIRYSVNDQHSSSMCADNSTSAFFRRCLKESLHTTHRHVDDSKCSFAWVGELCVPSGLIFCKMCV